MIARCETAGSGVSRATTANARTSVDYPALAMERVHHFSKLSHAATGLLETEDGQIRDNLDDFSQAAAAYENERNDRSCVDVRRNFWEMTHLLLTRLAVSRVPTISALFLE
jgi:hypothetical protein